MKPCLSTTTFFVSLALGLAGCSCGTSSTAPVTPPSAPDSEPSVIAQRAELEGLPEAVASRVAARIDEHEITVLDVAHELALEEGPALARDVLPRELPALLSRMVEARLLADEAARRDYGDAPEVRHARDEVLARGVASSLLADRVIAPPTLEEMQRYHRAHPELFSRPELARVRVMFIVDRARADAALARMQSARHFEEAWERISQTDAFRGPLTTPTDEIWIAREPRSGEPNMPPEVRRAAFELPGGEFYRAPIPADGGYYYVWTLVKLPATEQPLAEVEDAVRQALLVEARTRALRELSSPWIEGASIDEEALGAVHVPDNAAVGTPIVAAH